MVLIFIYILKFKIYIYFYTGYAHAPRHAILTVYSIEKL